MSKSRPSLPLLEVLAAYSVADSAYAAAEVDIQRTSLTDGLRRSR
jgi:hypothetical protein